jgi:hypothetical protein
MRKGARTIDHTSVLQAAQQDRREIIGGFVLAALAHLRAFAFRRESARLPCQIENDVPAEPLWPAFTPHRECLARVRTTRSEHTVLSA